MFVAEVFLAIPTFCGTSTPIYVQGYNNAEQPDEQEWEARKERMAQMEAVLMSAIAHDNIVRTYKVGQVHN